MKYGIFVMVRVLPLASTEFDYLSEQVSIRTNKREALSWVRELSASHPDYRYYVKTGGNIIASAKSGRVSHFTQY
jgi:hypothetical protein